MFSKENNVMKKFIALALASVMMFSLAACKKTSESSADASSEATVSSKGEGVMRYADYAAAAVDAPVVIEAYVQAKQSWWENKATLYLADTEGAYFVYNVTCSEADYAKLVEGQRIKVTGYKTEWSGEVEVAEGATFEIEEGNWISTYKWDGSGEQGDDLYFKVKIGGNEYTFTVESYLCGKDTEVYKAVEALQVGQTIDMEGFLYWYEGVNPHITKVTVK